MLSYVMPLGFAVRQVVAAQQVAAPQLDRVDAHLARRDVEQHLARQRLELPRPAVRGAPDGVRVDASWSRSPARGTRYGPGNSIADRGRRSDRPRGGVGAAVGARSRCARPGSRRRRRTPSSPSPCSWRDLPAASRFSRRSSTHFSGAPTFGAASIRHISSRWTITFCPKPPPVSRITTRMRCSGMPEQARAEQPHLVRRLRRGVDRELAGRARVVDDQAAAFHRRGGARLLVDRLASRRARPRRTRRRAPTAGRPLISPMTFEPCCSCTSAVACLGRRCSRRPRAAARSRRRRARPRPRASARVVGDHERDRVADEAHLVLGERRARRLRAQRPDRRVPLLLDVGVQVGRGEHRSARRAARARADASMPRIAARAYGLRTKYACSMPGSAMSSTYVPRPVSSRASSTRLTRVRRRTDRARARRALTRSARSGRRRPG